MTWHTKEYKRQDSTEQILDLLLTRKLDDLDIISETQVDDTSLNIETTGVTPLIGNYICLQEDVQYNQSQILSVTPIAGNQYTIGIDTPLDYAFSLAGGCSLTDADMSVDGSVTPVKFFISPALLASHVRWHTTRLMIYIQGTSAMDDGLFGDQPSLTNGVLFRLNNGIIKNLYNVKNNGDLAKRAFNREYASKAPAGKTSVIVRRTFNGDEKNGIVLPITGRGSVEVRVSDDLSAVDLFQVIAQGKYKE